MAFFADWSRAEEQNDFRLTGRKIDGEFSEQEQKEISAMVQDITILFENFTGPNTVVFVYSNGGIWNQPERGTDMNVISKRFPDVLFTLEGEQYHDGPLDGKVFFREYYQNGQMEHTEGKFEFEKFNRDNMKPIDTIIQNERNRESV